MNVKTIIHIILGAILFFCSCGRTTPESYIQYIDNKDHQLIRTTEIGPLKYEVKLQTPEYTLIKEMGLNSAKSLPFQESLRAKKNYLQFSIRISSLEEGNISLFKRISKNTGQYLLLNRYFENEIMKDLYWDIDGVKINPNVYFFTPNQGFTRYEEVIIGSDYFSPQIMAKAKKIQLVYNDQIFGHGPLFFTFYTKDINNIPPLKL